MAAKKNKKEKSKEIVPKDQNLPSFMQQGPARGMEEASVEDFEIPRLSLVQSLSACRDKDSAEYIAGIEEGELFNNVTRGVYGASVKLVPVYFRKEYLLWRDISKGGGFGGAASSMEEAEAMLSEQDNQSEWEITPTMQYYCLLLEDGKTPEQIVVSMAKSKNKISRRWNSLIRINGHDMFSRWYTLRGVSETNDNNQKYYNFVVNGGEFVSEDVYKAAEEMYELIQSGKVTINRDTEGEASDIPPLSW